MVASAAIKGGLSLAGALGGTALNIFGNAKSQKRAMAIQAALMNLQYQYNQRALREQYSNARQGLESAGYNPILAATQGVNSNGVGLGSVGTPSNPASDYGDNITNAVQTASNVKLQEANARNLDAGTENIQADTALKTVQKGIFECDKQIKENEAELRKKDVDTYDRRFLLEQNERLARTKHMLTDAGLMNYRAESERITSNAQQLQAKTNADVSTYDKQRYIEWRNKHPYQEGFTYGLGQYTGSLGKLFSGSASLSAKH